MAARNIFMDENELCKVGDFGLLRETSSRDDDEEKHYVMQVRILQALYLLIKYQKFIYLLAHC